MTPSVELAFWEKAELEHFLQEIESAARGQISAGWIERSYLALSPSVQQVVANRVNEYQQLSKENPL